MRGLRFPARGSSRPEARWRGCGRAVSVGACRGGSRSWSWGGCAYSAVSRAAPVPFGDEVRPGVLLHVYVCVSTFVV